MITKAQLIAARALIEDPAHWTQNAFARNATGESILIKPKGFVEPPSCYCLVGAMLTQLPPMPLWQKLNEIYEDLGKSTPNLTAFNDRSTHAEVIAYLDQLIEAAP